jgi:uncharacterized protein with von Willebrand factor type A (vWA) domain
VSWSLPANLLLFGRILRRLGLAAQTGRLLDVIDALGCLDISKREDVYHACRTLLVRSHDEIAVFDLAFDAFWREHTLSALNGGASGIAQPERKSSPEPPRHGRRSDAAGSAYDVPEVRDGGDQALRTWSRDTVIADKDFAAFTDEEMALATSAIEKLHWTPGERRTRRWVAGRGPRLDMRRAMARSLRTDGDVVSLPRRRRRRRPRPLVLICDVSGSMERYSRLLIHFAHALGRRHNRLEVFLFSTRLTRVTTAIRAARIDRALTGVTQSMNDWGGGTRTGEALRELNQRWSRRVLHRGPVVLLISDGWDRGDPDELRREVARLQRSCRRLIWLNPLIGTAGFEPLTRGLQAALPHVDDFLAARTLNNLADLARELNELD